MELFARGERFAAPTVTAFRGPEWTDWLELDRRLRAGGLIVGGNDGRLAGKNVRLGHMGTQADEALADAALDIVAEVHEALQVRV